MSKITFLIALFTCTLFGAVNSWESQHSFLLKKDEWGKVLVHEKAHPKRGWYEFWFRWTLYDGKNITVHSRYRDFPKQYNFMFDKFQDSFRQILLNDTSKNSQKKTYLLLNLDEFVKKEKKMRFNVLIKDSEKRLEIKYIDPKNRTKTK